MPSINGKSNNPNGRPKGAIGKKTAEQLKRVEYVLGILDETVKEDVLSLKPVERARLWESLQEYVRPRLQRTEYVDESDRDITIKIVRE